MSGWLNVVPAYDRHVTMPAGATSSAVCNLCQAGTYWSGSGEWAVVVGLRGKRLRVHCGSIDADKAEKYACLNARASDKLWG